MKAHKPHDSYLLRYQELKHMRQNKNPLTNQNLQHSSERDDNAPDEPKEEMPQINEELDGNTLKKTPKGNVHEKSKLCVIL